MDAKEWATIMASGGGGAVVLAFVTGIIKWLSGASGRERQKNTDLNTQRRNAIKDRDNAEAERDKADDKRREAEEHVAMLKNQVRELGKVPVERPNKE